MTLRDRKLLLAVAAVSAAGSAQAASPPAFKSDRAAEDYGYLHDKTQKSLDEAYKFMPLDDQGTVYLSLGGEVRSRIEAYDAPRFGLGGHPDTYLLQRTLVHADLHLGDTVRVFAQFGDHEAVGKKQVSATDENSFDFEQLFVDLKPADSVLLRVGRQEISFNATQRFVSVRDGANVRQSFDGARATYTGSRVRIEGFAVRPLTLDRGAFDDGRNDDVLFAGSYGSYRLAADKKAPTIDAYYFYLERDALQVGARRGNDRRHTIGVRFAGTKGAYDYDAEAVVQRGHLVGSRIRAGGVFVDVGRSFKTAPAEPRLGLRLDWGSGDGDPSDRTAGSFYPLFPKGPYFNEAGLTSFTNLLGLRTSAKGQLTPKLTTEAAVQFKWRAEATDAVYLQPSTALASTRANTAREIGEVYTADLNYQANRHLSLRAYYLRHTAGDAIRAAGGRAVDFIMTSACFKF